MNLTGKTLQLIAETPTLERCNEIANYLNLICPNYGLNNANVMHEFLATIIHESGAFRIKSENMNYTTAERIKEVWPSRFNLTGKDGKLNANNYIRNPKLLANTVYNGRMGNRTGTDDGFNFRGSGFIQLTGRESFTAYAKYHGGTDLEYYANLLRTDDWWAVDCACWEFCVDKKLLPLAQTDQFQTITKRINGGLIGWKERQYFYARAKQYLKD
ncbi:MAG: glycohydrolase [Pseudopedobacter saltans]|uniref:Glycohydrolase n=1 Tax=Pseudopedobacter saltans TaxID=151895 RepID=A0A2W5ECW6_9SPHI|nr:MAG: glycohydrolase [Pseudopedobacter saltans]